MSSVTTQEFIDKVLLKFPNHHLKYDYSKVIYVRTHDKVIITCKSCGDFEQAPSKHLSGRNCPNCKLTDLTSLKQLAEDNGFFLVSDQTITSKEKAKVVCKKCGNTCNKQLRHLKKGSGCVVCFADSMRQDTEYFLAKVRQNDNYDFSYSVYSGAHNKLTVLCKRHGYFNTTPTGLYEGKGCPSCGKERLSPYNETIAERNREKFSKTESGFYVLRVGDFYKIGIAKWLKSRLNRLIRQVKLPVEVISYTKSDLYSCIKLEQSLLKVLPLMTFKEEERFDGYTECFYLESDEISNLVEFVEQELNKEIIIE